MVNADKARFRRLLFCSVFQSQAVRSNLVSDSKLLSVDYDLFAKFSDYFSMFSLTKAFGKEKTFKKR